MATVFNVICDIHDAQGAQVPADAEGVPIRFARYDLEVDLCQACLDQYQQLLQPLIDVARKAGKSTAPTRRRLQVAQSDEPTAPSAYKRDEPNSPDGDHFLCRASKYQADSAGCDRSEAVAGWPGFDTSQARGMHERRAHNFNMAELRALAKEQGKSVEDMQLLAV